jgi:hypothetical protein
MILSAAALTEVRLARSHGMKVMLARGESSLARFMVVAADVALRPVKTIWPGLCLASSTTISTPMPPVPIHSVLVIV